MRVNHFGFGSTIHPAHPPLLGGPGAGSAASAQDFSKTQRREEREAYNGLQRLEGGSCRVFFLRFLIPGRTDRYSHDTRPGSQEACKTPKTRAGKESILSQGPYHFASSQAGCSATKKSPQVPSRFKSQPASLRCGRRATIAAQTCRQIPLLQVQLLSHPISECLNFLGRHSASLSLSPASGYILLLYNNDDAGSCSKKTRKSRSSTS
jgi:hypothetical protein